MLWLLCCGVRCCAVLCAVHTTAVLLQCAAMLVLCLCCAVHCCAVLAHCYSDVAVCCHAVLWLLLCYVLCCAVLCCNAILLLQHKVAHTAQAHTAQAQHKLTAHAHKQNKTQYELSTSIQHRVRCAAQLSRQLFTVTQRHCVEYLCVEYLQDCCLSLIHI